ncbi:winged helix-turn-helix domain-containing protein [Halorussus lipolyticus]|uniref:winged helix-turn-helix domain-containing protein n=1 Tax=Halorussus lipolyticus TaxID=3034024 RepID=UPI0023E81B00|nr:helix-turn-helix domain-containing protein [Halorussus sp. DT80]
MTDGASAEEAGPSDPETGRKDDEADRRSDGTDRRVERRSPDETFELLANEVRVEILRALGDDPRETLGFSELHDRVDIADSGNFNYHLDRLVGAFVRKVGDGSDGDADTGESGGGRDGAGYELTRAGQQIVGAMYAGTYTTDAAVEPISAGWDCLLCSGEMVVGYADERAHFWCSACDEGAKFSFPPGTVDQFDRDELPGAFARWYHHLMTRLFHGFCGVCAGRMDGEFVRLPGGTERNPETSLLQFTCQRCGTVASSAAETLATFHPVAQGFFAEHGFDVSARHPTQMWGELDACDVEILSEEPPRMEVRFGHDGEEVRAVVEPDATVGQVERRSRQD